MLKSQWDSSKERPRKQVSQKCICEGRKERIQQEPWEPLTPQWHWRTGNEHRTSATEEETSRLPFTLYQCFRRTTPISLLLTVFLPAGDQVASLEHRRLPRVDKEIKLIPLLTHLHLALHNPTLGIIPACYTQLCIKRHSSCGGLYAIPIAHTPRAPCHFGMVQ